MATLSRRERLGRTPRGEAVREVHVEEERGGFISRIFKALLATAVGMLAFLGLLVVVAVLLILAIF